MNRSFRTTLATARGARLALQVTCAFLAVLNLAAILLLITPPDGTRTQLTIERQRLRSQTATTLATSVRLKKVAGAVQTGRRESADFRTRYFLPRRAAYAALIEEIQRITLASGMSERDAVYGEEPIDGTDDLSIMNATANYEGSYDNLQRFLREIDRSPMLLMLDNLHAVPQEKSGIIDTSIRFQTVISDDGSQIIGVEP